MVCENIHDFMILMLCSEVRNSFITKYVYTHKEFDLATQASKNKVRIVQHTWECKNTGASQ